MKNPEAQKHGVKVAVFAAAERTTPEGEVITKLTGYPVRPAVPSSYDFPDESGKRQQGRKQECDQVEMNFRGSVPEIMDQKQSPLPAIIHLPPHAYTVAVKKGVSAYKDLSAQDCFFGERLFQSAAK